MRDPMPTVEADPQHSERPAIARPRVQRGTVSLICGPMFSGKTTELLRRLDALPSALAIKHVIDRRYRPDAIVSHSGQALSARVVASARDISGWAESGVQIVGIDEAHFFDEDLIEVTRSLVARGVSVIMTALNIDSWGRPFPVVQQLRTFADESIVLRATCARCSRPACHTQRLTPIVGGRMVGGPESYEPRCQRCWTPPPETRGELQG